MAEIWKHRNPLEAVMHHSMLPERSPAMVSAPARMIRSRAAGSTGHRHLAVTALAMSLAVLSACTPGPPPAPTTGPTPSAVGTTSFSGSNTNLAPAQLEVLVSPIALYPDDLLALVLPASTQPLQVVEAQRFLQQRDTASDVQPSKTWDPSVVALLNYREALARISADHTWLRQLGTSVVYQQAGVMDAVQSFRKKVLEAGNLKSDARQTVSVQADGSGMPQVIVIEPTNAQVIYVPVYDPSTVIYAAAPGYPYPYTWSTAYPYYYDPLAPYYTGAFFGVAIGFGCDWDDDDIYYGEIDIDEINIDRDKLKQRFENRQNSNLANQIRNNRENVWRPDPGGLNRVQAGGGLNRVETGGSFASRQGLAVDSYRSSASGAFSGVDRGAAATRYSMRGTASMSGGFRGGGGSRGGGGRGGGRR